MNIFDRMGSVFKSIFTSLFGSQEPTPALLAQSLIRKQKTSERRLKESLTELIFQRKKLETQLEKMENKRFNLKEDIEMAAAQDRDELAIRLMEEMDLLVKEIAETETNLDLVRSEIDTAKEVEVELKQQIDRSASQLAILVSRSESVKMREELHGQFAKIYDEITHMKPGLNVVEENILKLESRLENLPGPNQEWKREVVKLRKERTDHFRQARLQQLKAQLRGRQLAGQVIIPEIVKTH